MDYSGLSPPDSPDLGPIFNQPDLTREEEIYFGSWGVPEGPSMYGWDPRTVLIRGIPQGLPAAEGRAIVVSMIFGGTIEYFIYTPGENRAYVTFTSSEAAAIYHGLTLSGVHYNKSPYNFTVQPALVSRDQPVPPRLQALLEFGASRVINISHCPENYTFAELEEMAVGNKHRVLEKAYTRSPSIAGREIVFRFMNIYHARDFMNEIKNKKDFIGAHVSYGEDPCHHQRGIHYE